MALSPSCNILSLSCKVLCQRVHLPLGCDLQKSLALRGAQLSSIRFVDGVLKLGPCPLLLYLPDLVLNVFLRQLGVDRGAQLLLRFFPNLITHLSHLAQVLVTENQWRPRIGLPGSDMISIEL